MTELVVACFDTQFEANSAAEKLLSRGLQRDQIVLTFDESIQSVPSSSSAPTTVISDVSHTGSFDTSAGQKKEQSGHSSPERHEAPDPTLIGHTTLVIALHGEMSMDEVCALLDDAGASSVNSEEHQESRTENASMWPSVGNASREDVQRSIDAAKRGANLRSRRPR
ncbi:hypothetical protein [Dyella sp. 2HG41-7]|uniref:hypothetical protein n=1 Tax=Dyella sp. 2HG41-7 TaxID=2883239 RepID=UPI001F3B177F|nr:hypothetical protein [Dyella sp. 2HG41-7]